MTQQRVVTFELSKDGDELEVHFSRAGLRWAIDELTRLSETSSLPDHQHWMTPEWGGQELSGRHKDVEGALLNKVTIRLWDFGEE